jgi:hypothetical protein
VQISANAKTVLNRAVGGSGYLPVVYSGEDIIERVNYYVVYLGHIDNVPMVSSNTSTHYNGVSPIQLSYSVKETEEQTIIDSMTRCVEETTTTTKTNYSKVSGGLGFSFFSLGVQNESTKTITESMTVTNTETLTTINNYSKTNEGETTYNIGYNGEPAGRYRISIFATADVFYAVKMNEDNTQILDEEVSVIVRNDSLTIDLDYDPNPSGDFGKNSKSETLPVPDNFTAVPVKPKYMFYYWEDEGAANGTPIVHRTAGGGFSSTSHVDYMTAYYFIDDLRKEGYKEIEIKITFDKSLPQTVQTVTPGPGGYETSTAGNSHGKQKVAVRWGHGGNGRQWDAAEWTYSGAAADRNRNTVECVLKVPITDFSNQFTINWTAEFTGSTEIYNHTWTLYNRSVFITALK